MSAASHPPENESIDNRRVARDLGTSSLARLAGVIEVVAQPLYVLMYGLASFGLYSVLWSIVNLVENFADLGMTSAMQRTVPQAASRREQAHAFRAALILGVLPCLAIAIGAALYAHEVAHLFNAAPEDEERLADAIRIFAWALPLWAFVEIATSALRAQRLFGPEIRLRVFWEQVIRLLFAVVFWLLGWGFVGLLAAHLVSLTLTAVLAARLAIRFFSMEDLLRGRAEGPIFWETARAGLAIMPANVSQRFYSDGGVIALNWILPGAAGAVAAGLFTIARKISSLIQAIRLAFAYVLAPLASAASRGAREEVRSIYGFATGVLTALALPAGMVLAAGAPAVLSLFGKQADPAIPAVMILVGSRIVEALAGAAQPIQQVISSYRAQLVAANLGMVVAVVVGLALLPEWGLTGMAVAVTAGLCTGAILPVFQMWWDEGLSPFSDHFGRTVAVTLAVAVAGAGLAWLANLLPDELAIPTILVLMLGSTWLACRYGLPREDRLALGKTGRALKLV
ncbi:MAG: lipopolysaccharide biosynthesis protein [Cypionkella sp.]